MFPRARSRTARRLTLSPPRPLFQSIFSAPASTWKGEESQPKARRHTADRCRTNVSKTTPARSPAPPTDAGQSSCRPWRASWLLPALTQGAGRISSLAPAGRSPDARFPDGQSRDAFRVSWLKSTTWGSGNKCGRLPSTPRARKGPHRPFRKDGRPVETPRTLQGVLPKLPR